MFQYLKGTITMRFEGGVVLETGGVGFQVFVPDNSPLYREIGNTAVTIYTTMIVREDDMSLYGFSDMETLMMFQKLRTVNGVGAKAALAILSALTLDELKKAIVFDDPVLLTKANGIGKKTASRIVLELKEKIEDMVVLTAIGDTIKMDDRRSEAINALIGLGYNRSEALAMLSGVSGEELSTEDYIRLALRGGAGR